MIPRWTYLQYQASVRGDIEYAMGRLGFLPGAALGRAYNELALRLDEYPAETALALVAIANEARTLNMLDEFPADDAFLQHFLQYLQPLMLKEAGSNLSAEEKEVLAGDAALAMQAINARKPKS